MYYYFNLHFMYVFYIYIAFHHIVHIVAFYMINETVYVSVHNFAFFAI